MVRRHTTGFDVLGFDADPTPGDPETILNEIVRTYVSVGDDAAAAFAAVNSGAMANAKGEAMDGLRKQIGDKYPPKLQQTADSFHAAAEAYKAFGQVLEDAQSQLDRAMDQAGPVADTANRTVDPLPADATDQQRAQAQQTQKQIDQASADLTAAKQLAQDAKDMRDRAATTFDSTLRGVATVPERDLFKRIADAFVKFSEENPWFGILVDVAIGLVALANPVVGLALGAAWLGVSTALNTVGTGKFDVGSFVVGVIGVAAGGLGIAAKLVPGLGKLAGAAGGKAGSFFTSLPGGIGKGISASAGGLKAASGAINSTKVGSAASEAVSEFGTEAVGGVVAAGINGQAPTADDILPGAGAAAGVGALGGAIHGGGGRKGGGGLGGGGFGGGADVGGVSGGGDGPTGTRGFSGSDFGSDDSTAVPSGNGNGLGASNDATLQAPPPPPTASTSAGQGGVTGAPPPPIQVKAGPGAAGVENTAGSGGDNDLPRGGPDEGLSTPPSPFQAQSRPEDSSSLFDASSDSDSDSNQAAVASNQQQGGPDEGFSAPPSPFQAQSRPEDSSSLFDASSDSDSDSDSNQGAGAAEQQPATGDTSALNDGNIQNDADNNDNSNNANVDNMSNESASNNAQGAADNNTLNEGLENNAQNDADGNALNEGGDNNAQNNVDSNTLNEADNNAHADADSNVQNNSDSNDTTDNANVDNTSNESGSNNAQNNADSNTLNEADNNAQNEANSNNNNNNDATNTLNEGAGNNAQNEGVNNTGNNQNEGASNNGNNGNNAQNDANDSDGNDNTTGDDASDVPPDVANLTGGAPPPPVTTSASDTGGGLKTGASQAADTSTASPPPGLESPPPDRQGADDPNQSEGLTIEPVSSNTPEGPAAVDSGTVEAAGIAGTAGAGALAATAAMGGKGKGKAVEGEQSTPLLGDPKAEQEGAIADRGLGGPKAPPTNFAFGQALKGAGSKFKGLFGGKASTSSAGEGSSTQGGSNAQSSQGDRGGNAGDAPVRPPRPVRVGDTEIAMTHEGAHLTFTTPEGGKAFIFRQHVNFEEGLVANSPDYTGPLTLKPEMARFVQQYQDGTLELNRGMARWHHHFNQVQGGNLPAYGTQVRPDFETGTGNTAFIPFTPSGGAAAFIATGQSGGENVSKTSGKMRTDDFRFIDGYDPNPALNQPVGVVITTIAQPEQDIAFVNGGEIQLTGPMAIDGGLTKTKVITSGMKLSEVYGEPDDGTGKLVAQDLPAAPSEEEKQRFIRDHGSLMVR